MKGILSRVVLTAVLAAFAVPAFAQDAAWDAGVSYYKQQQYRRAIAEFQKVVDAHPEFANTYYYMGMGHFFLKEYGPSIIQLNKYIELAEQGGKKPDSAARAALGRAHIFRKEFQKAVTVLSVLTQTVTDDPLNFYYLGVAYQNLNDEDKAIEAYSAALKLNTKDEITLDQLARLLLARALRTGAKEDFQAAITRAESLRLVRDDADTAALLGTAYLGIGDFAKAAVHFGRVVETRTTDGGAWYNYGLSLSRSQQFPKAETALVKATSLLPDNGDVFFELGFVQESMKKYKDALVAYEKANELKPSPMLQDAINRVRPVAEAQQQQTKTTR